jgi:hypothetical protein
MLKKLVLIFLQLGLHMLLVWEKNFKYAFFLNNKFPNGGVA